MKKTAKIDNERLREGNSERERVREREKLFLKLKLRNKNKYRILINKFRGNFFFALWNIDNNHFYLIFFQFKFRLLFCILDQFWILI